MAKPSQQSERKEMMAALQAVLDWAVSDDATFPEFAEDVIPKVDAALTRAKRGK